MKAIYTTRYGTHQIQATDHAGNTVRIDRAPELNAEGHHDSAARALCSKLDWHGTFHKGYALRHGVTVGRIYVWSAPSDDAITV